MSYPGPVRFFLLFIIDDIQNIEQEHKNRNSDNQAPNAEEMFRENQNCKGKKIGSSVFADISFGLRKYVSIAWMTKMTSTM